MTSRSALFFTKISVAWAWAAPDFYAVGELHINAFYTNSTTFVCFNYGLNIELLHTKKAGIFTCSDRDHNSEKKLYNCNSFDPLSSKYLAIANARWIFWTLAYRVQFFFLAAKKIGLCKPVSKWFTSHPSFKRNSYLGVRENSRVFQWKDICFLWQIQYHSWMASKYDSWNCPVNF